MSGKGEVAIDESGKILMIEFDFQPLAILQFQSIRWLSRGLVLKQFVFFANNIRCFPSGGCRLVSSS